MIICQDDRTQEIDKGRKFTGLPRIINRCKEYGLPAPVFDEFGDGFKVILFRKTGNAQEKVSNDALKTGNAQEKVSNDALKTSNAQEKVSKEF